MTEEQIVNLLTDIDSGLIQDRSKLDELTNKLQTIESKLDTLYNRLPRTEEKIRNAVADGMAETVAPVIEMVNHMKTATKHIYTGKRFNWFGFRKES